MHKIRNEKASAMLQENSTYLITKTQHIIDNTTLSFQVKQVKFRCAIYSKVPSLWNGFNSKFERAVVRFLYFKKTKSSTLSIENPQCYFE